MGEVAPLYEEAEDYIKAAMHYRNLEAKDAAKRCELKEASIQEKAGEHYLAARTYKTNKEFEKALSAFQMALQGDDGRKEEIEAEVRSWANEQMDNRDFEKALPLFKLLGDDKEVKKVETILAELEPKSG